MKNKNNSLRPPKISTRHKWSVSLWPKHPDKDVHIDVWAVKTRGGEELITHTVSSSVWNTSVRSCITYV